MKQYTITLNNTKLYTLNTPKHPQKQAKTKTQHKAPITILILITIIFSLMILNVLANPEVFCTTFSYQLKNDVTMGNPQAIAYMNRNK
jgi:hypothetical protein